jgi:hypothetical protein
MKELTPFPSFLLSSLLAISILFGYSVVWGADWKQVRSTGSATLYYDTEEITHPSKDIVKVLTKWVYTEKGIRNAKEIFGEKYENLSYSIKSYEIKCTDRTSRILSITDYNKDGTVISSDSKTNPEWSHISPESVLETLYKMVCK